MYVYAVDTVRHEENGSPYLATRYFATENGADARSMAFADARRDDPQAYIPTDAHAIRCVRPATEDEDGELSL